MELNDFPNETLSHIAEQCDTRDQLKRFACTSVKMSIIFETEKWRRQGPEAINILSIIPGQWATKDRVTLCAACEEGEHEDTCLKVSDVC